MLIAGAAAPYIPAKILMPVRKIIVPQPLGILQAHDIAARQLLVNSQWAMALSVMAMREGRLVRIVSEFVTVGDLVLEGGKLDVKLRGGDKVAAAMLEEQIVTGTAIMKMEIVGGGGGGGGKQ